MQATRADFCADADHAFNQGIEPYLAVRVGLWDALHMDNNIVQSHIMRYQFLAEDMDAHFKTTTYKKPASGVSPRYLLVSGRDTRVSPPD